MSGGYVTIKDIARKLGISPSTVSRALKNHPDISTKTKKAVQELARILNYEPNAIALSLRTSKSHLIGVIIPEIVHYYFSSIISGIENFAYNASYNILFTNSNESYAKEVIDTQSFLSSRIDGLLVAISKETKNYEHFTNLEKNNIPMVFFDRICEELDTDKVITDDYNGAFQAVDHLINQGCKRIAHL